MKKIPRISESEWLVMKVLWARSPATTTDVVEELLPTTSWKLKTVLTLLNRLVKKGAVGYDKQGRAYQYYPLLDENECVREETRSFLARVHGGAFAPMFAHFIEEASLNPREIQDLKDLLERKGRKKR